MPTSSTTRSHFAPGQVANLRLPKRLKKKDSEQLGAFLETLVLEPQREIPAATGPAS